MNTVVNTHRKRHLTCKQSLYIHMRPIIHTCTHTHTHTHTQRHTHTHTHTHQTHTHTHPHTPPATHTQINTPMLNNPFPPPPHAGMLSCMQTHVCSCMPL